MKKKIVYIFLLLLVSCNNPRNNSLKEIEDEVIVPKKELVSLDDIDSKLMTIDDFLK